MSVEFISVLSVGQKEREWIHAIDQYCALNGITPDDLIRLHQIVSKTAKMGKFEGKE